MQPNERCDQLGVLVRIIESHPIGHNDTEGSELVHSWLVSSFALVCQMMGNDHVPGWTIRHPKIVPQIMYVPVPMHCKCPSIGILLVEVCQGNRGPWESDHQPYEWKATSFVVDVLVGRW